MTLQTVKFHGAEIAASLSVSTFRWHTNFAAGIRKGDEDVETECFTVRSKLFCVAGSCRKLALLCGQRPHVCAL